MWDSDGESSSDEKNLMMKQRTHQEQSGVQFFVEQAEATSDGNYETCVTQQPLVARMPNEPPTPVQQIVQTIEQHNEREMSEEEIRPTHKDPKLWRIKCRKGEEKAAVLNLMRRFLKNEFTEIKSVVFPENVKSYDNGCVYVEAFTHKDVKEAVECGEGVPSLRKGVDIQETVHIEDMTNVLRVVKEKKDLTDLKPLSWVRLNNKQANFKGDICQLIYNAVKEKKLLLKLIPRLDYTTPRGTQRSRVLSKASTSTAKRQQPDRKKFNVEDLRAVGGIVDFGDHKFVKFEQKWYSRTGFLYYTFSYDAVQAVVTPTLAETAEFEDADVEDIQLAFKVTSGLRGHFIEVDREEISVRPQQVELEPPIESEASKQENYSTITESERTASASTASGSNPSTSPPIGGSTTVDHSAASPSNRHREGEGGGDPLLGRLVQVTVGPDIGKLGKVTRVTESVAYVQLSPADCAIPFYRCQIKVWISAPEVSSPSDSTTSLAFHAPAEIARKSLSPEDESLWYNLWYLDRLPENLYEGNEVYDTLEEFYEAQFNEELTPDDQSSTTAKLSAREIESNLTSTKNPEYQPGTWVRVLRVPYKGDLAQVISYDTNENDILLKLIPRIDYDRPRGAFRTTLSDAEAKKRRKIQHKPQLFDQKEIERNGGSCTTDGDTITFEGKCYRSGFLIAKFPSTQVRSENPSLAEIENFLHPNEPFKSQPTGKSTTVPDFMAPSSSNQPREGGRSGGQTFNRAQGIYKGKVATIKRVPGSSVNVDLTSGNRTIPFGAAHIYVSIEKNNATESHTQGSLTPPHDGSPTRDSARMTNGSQSSQSDSTRDRIVSKTSSRRPIVFGNLDRNPNSLIPGADPPLDSLLPSRTTNPQGRGTPNAAAFGTRTPINGSHSRHFGEVTHESSSPSQPDRARYDNAANISACSLSAYEDPVKWNDKSTPGGGMDVLSSQDWYTTNIQVRFRHNDQNAISGLFNQIGVIQEMFGKSASVLLLSDDRVVTVASNLLEPVVPNRFDRVKIIRGEQRRGETGALLQLDQKRGRVRLDSSGEEQLFELRNICKMPKSHED